MTKRLRKKIGAVMLCIMLMCLTVSSGAHAASIQDIIGLAAAFNSSGEYMAVSNGFLIDSGNGLYLVTTYSDQWELAASVSIVSDSGNGQAVSLINSNAGGVAMMEISGSMTACPLNAVGKLMSMSEGDTLIYAGVDPNAEADTIAQACIIGETTLTGFTEADGYTFGVTADEFDPVLAGGPVLSSDGVVVGVLSARGAVLPIEYIINTISESTGGTGDDGGTSGGESGGSSGGSTGDGGGEGGGSTDGGSSGGGSTSLSSMVPVLSGYFLTIVFGGAIVFAASLIVYLNKENRKRAAGKQEFDDMFRYLGAGTGNGDTGRGSGLGGSGGFGDAGTGAAIEGSGGYFSGRRLKVSGRPLVLGRDPARCSAVYPSDTKGISGLHCQVSLSGNEVILMDCGSTYGTFLAGGQRLKANIPYKLQRGDTFYLAEPKNTFRVV